jgi:TonB family protein
MRSARIGKSDSGQIRSEMWLGRCLVEGDSEATSSARRIRRKTFGASLAIEMLLLGLLVAAPLLSSVAQPQIHQNLAPPLAFFGGWRRHSPVQPAVALTTARKPEIPNPFQQTPVFGVTVHVRDTEEPGEAAAPDVSGEYVPGGTGVTELERIPPPIEPPRIEQPAHPEKRILKLSEGVLEAQLISRVEPRYPPLALQTRQWGTVVLHAIISRDGRINALEVVSGSPFFVEAALDAVRQWRYRPTLLNGEPVEVETTITVEFRLQR